MQIETGNRKNLKRRSNSSEKGRIERRIKQDSSLFLEASLLASVHFKLSICNFSGSNLCSLSWCSHCVPVSMCVIIMAIT